MKKEMLNLLVSLGMAMVLAGCSNVSAGEAGAGNTAPESASATESVSDVEDVKTAGTAAEEDVSAQDNDMGDSISAEKAAAAGTISDEEVTVSSDTAKGNENEQEQDVIKNYSGLRDLLSDADCLVKAEVLDAETKNVRSYIYTSYTVEVVDILYGEVQKSSHSLNNGISEPVLTVNLPGGTLEGEAASAMQKEVSEGKDAGNLPDTDSISSDGNTDRLLQKGDVAYLFLVPESEDAYAVVGEYEGVVFVDNNKVILNASISDAGQELTEEDFINLIEKLTVVDCYGT